METDNQKLLKLLNVKDIRFIDSHETLLSLEGWSGDDDAVSLNNSISVARNDPERKDDLFIVHPRYEMMFSEKQAEGAEAKQFFRAVYVLEVVFKSENPEEVEKMFKDENVKKFFFKNQMNHTLWSILRSRVMNAFSNHSLKPIVLPWIQPIKK